MKHERHVHDSEKVCKGWFVVNHIVTFKANCFSGTESPIKLKFCVLHLYANLYENF